KQRQDKGLARSVEPGSLRSKAIRGGQFAERTQKDVGGVGLVQGGCPAPFLGGEPNAGCVAGPTGGRLSILESEDVLRRAQVRVLPRSPLLSVALTLSAVHQPA